MAEQSQRTRSEYSGTPARREKILEAAVEVFAASGYNKGSLREVADLADLSQAGVLHHYPSKAHLMEAVLLRRDNGWGPRFTESGSGRERLLALVDLVRYNQVEAPKVAELALIVAAEAVRPAHPLHSYFEKRYVWLVEYVSQSFREAVAEGWARGDLDPVSAARATLAVMHGLELQWLYNRDAVDMAAEVQKHLNTYQR